MQPGHLGLVECRKIKAAPVVWVSTLSEQEENNRSELHRTSILEYCQTVHLFTEKLSVLSRARVIRLSGAQAYRKRLFSYFFHSVSLFLYFLLSNNSNPKVCNQRANFSRASLLIGLNQQPEEINNQDLSAICFKPG